MKKCCNCNKEVKTPRPAICHVCGEPLCYACKTRNLLCSDCNIQTNAEQEMKNYFKDKYEQKDVFKC